MAARAKKGLEYFPLQTDFRSDDKIVYLQSRHGMEGIGVWVSILTELYRVGYCYRASEQELAILSIKLGVKEPQLSKIISTMIDIGLFNKKIYEDYGFLTSKAIQETYLFCAGRRTTIKMIHELVLVDDLPDTITLKYIKEIESKIKVKVKSSNTHSNINLQNANNLQHNDDNMQHNVTLCIHHWDGKAIKTTVQEDIPLKDLEKIKAYHEGCDRFEEHVYIKPNLYKKLLSQFPIGAVHEKITSMDSQIANKVKKYTNYSDHYKCINSWLTSDVANGKLKKNVTEKAAESLNITDDDFNTYG